MSVFPFTFVFVPNSHPVDLLCCAINFERTLDRQGEKLMWCHFISLSNTVTHYTLLKS